MLIPTNMLASWHLGAIVTLMLVFSLAGITKLRMSKKFVDSVAAYTGFSYPLSKLIARWLPRLELTLSLLLPWPPLSPWIAGTLSLLIMFFLLGGLRAHGKEPIECGCFGDVVVEQPGMVAWWRNILLLIFSISVISINVPQVLSAQWLFLAIIPSLLVLISLQIEIIHAVREM